MEAMLWALTLAIGLVNTSTPLSGSDSAHLPLPPAPPGFGSAFDGKGGAREAINSLLHGNNWVFAMLTMLSPALRVLEHKADQLVESLGRSIACEKGILPVARSSGAISRVRPGLDASRLFWTPPLWDDALVSMGRDPQDAGTQRRLIAKALMRLLFWHALQPLLYFAALYFYWDHLLGFYFWVTFAIGCREASYLCLTLLLTCLRPSFLLVQAGLTWSGGRNGPPTALRIVLAPEGFIADVLFRLLGMQYTSYLKLQENMRVRFNIFFIGGLFATVWLPGIFSAVYSFFFHLFLRIFWAEHVPCSELIAMNYCGAGCKGRHFVYYSLAIYVTVVFKKYQDGQRHEIPGRRFQPVSDSARTRC